MFDRLIDVLLKFLHLFRFWLVIHETFAAVVMRLGKHNRTLGPGFHWVMPLGIEHYWLDNTAPASMTLESQVLTTKDGKCVIVSVILLWRIVDMEKLYYGCEGAESVMADAACGEVGEYVRKRDWETLRNARMGSSLRTRLNKRAARYGIEVERVQVRDLAITRAYRVIGNRAEE